MTDVACVDCGAAPVQAVEAKEGVEIQNETVTLASISYQNFFRSYPVRLPVLAGMHDFMMNHGHEGLQYIVLGGKRA